ncbi:MAG: glycosyltransferase [Sulfitobacter sp.]
MRVAIVHYWLVKMRGGEKVLEALCELYPQADIFTLVYDPTMVSDTIRDHRVTTSFLQRIPWGRKHYQAMLPLMPWALEGLDLSGYDLVLSSESGPAKGVICPPHAVHICYCHSPMRYIWDHAHLYRASAGFLRGAALAFCAPWLRMWDVTTSARVDYFVANSNHVAARISKYYRRSAVVVPPPVDTEAFTVQAQKEDFYLCASELVDYKRVDLAVAVCTQTSRRLIVVGEGPQLARLKAIAGPSVHFAGRLETADLRAHLARCRALIFPGEEDFGIIPVEAMAAGTPVIAYGSGGARDSVLSGKTGVFFDEQTPLALAQALDLFEETGVGFSAARIAAHAAKFNKATFQFRMKEIIASALAAKNPARPGAGTSPFARLKTRNGAAHLRTEA